MLKIYRLVKGIFEKVDDIQIMTSSDLIWVDMISPTPRECAYVAQTFKQPIKMAEDLGSIESSARFFENEHGLHILSFFLVPNRGETTCNTTISFTLHDNCIFSCREREISACRLYRLRTKNVPLLDATSPYEILLGLLSLKTELLADELEFIYNALEHLHPISCPTNLSNFQSILLDLANFENSTSKIRFCLIDTQRAFKFLLQKLNKPLDATHAQKSLEMLQNVESLLPHNEMLFQRLNFLTQTTIGMIQMDQNRIMENLCKLSVVILPFSLCASWFGMDLQSFFGQHFYLWPYQTGLILAVLAITYFSYRFLMFYKTI